jgi:hypothetical protein
MSTRSFITVLESGKSISFGFDDLLKYHGPHYPGGVAHAFKVMELAFPLLDRKNLLERREISIITPFSGPGRARRLRNGDARHNGRPLYG